ncbi:hypothetical protein BH23BAC3_BH23BAC3_06870 [soil metagenome]
MIVIYESMKAFAKPSYSFDIRNDYPVIRGVESCQFTTI